MKSSPLNYVDPSGHYTFEEGNEAHRILQVFLKAALGEIVDVEKQIPEVWKSSTGKLIEGRADIVFWGPPAEVYEIKSYSYKTDTKLHKDGTAQREEYIKGLINVGYDVNSHGYSLDVIINLLVLPSIEYAQVFYCSTDDNSLKEVLTNGSTIMDVNAFEGMEDIAEIGIRAGALLYSMYYIISKYGIFTPTF